MVSALIKLHIKPIIPFFVIVILITGSVISKNNNEASLKKIQTETRPRKKRGKRQHKLSQQKENPGKKTTKLAQQEKAGKQKKKMQKKQQNKKAIKVAQQEIKESDQQPEKKKSIISLQKERKTISTMSFEELKNSKNQLLASNNKTIAIKYLEKMVPLCNDFEELKLIMLELADLLFDTGKLEKAGKMYTEFTKLYPGSDKVEYATYKNILCAFYSVFEVDRDQSKTKEALELTEQFLARSDLFTTYEKDVKNINKKCHEKLVESEINIFTFYMNKGSLTAAQKRLDGIRKDFLPQLPSLEARFINLECQLAQKQNNTKLAEQKRTELTQKFPEYSTKLTANKTKRSFVHRF